jgi:hypothetical protein
MPVQTATIRCRRYQGGTPQFELVDTRNNVIMGWPFSIVDDADVRNQAPNVVRSWNAFVERLLNDGWTEMGGGGPSGGTVFPAVTTGCAVTPAPVMDSPSGEGI